MKKKILTAVLCGFFITTSLAGCASSPSAKTTSDEKSEVTASVTSATEFSDDTTAKTTPKTETTAAETESKPIPPAEREETEPQKPQTTQTVTPQSESPAESKPSEQPKPEPVKEQTDDPQPAKETEPSVPPQTETPNQPEPTKEPESTSPPAPESKSIYDYEFDAEAIRQELIAVGTSMGLTHTGDMTPDTASWSNPVTASQSFQGSGLERSLKDYVRSMPSMITAYGGNPIQYFTIYEEPLGGGSYRFYFLY